MMTGPNMAATSQRNGGLAPQRPPPPSTIDHHTAANTCHWTKRLPRKTEGSRHLPRVRVQASQAKHQTYSALSIPKGEHICCLRRGTVTLTPSSQTRRE